MKRIVLLYRGGRVEEFRTILREIRKAGMAGRKLGEMQVTALAVAGSPRLDLTQALQAPARRSRVNKVLSNYSAAANRRWQSIRGQLIDAQELA